MHLKYLKGKIRQAPVVGVNVYVCTNYSLPLQYLLHEKKDLLHCTDISIVQITEKNIHNIVNYILTCFKCTYTCKFKNNSRESMDS